jgi:periplasmic protein TonB
MMRYPGTDTTRLRSDAQLRTLYACFGVSIALHGIAMFAFPALQRDYRPADARMLTALFESRAEAEAVAPPAPRRPRERNEAEPRVPAQKPVDPVPVAAAQTEEPVPAPAANPQPAVPASVASSSPAPASSEAAQPSAEAFDASLLEAYRLALIDAAKRYKRYPAQAMERGWEGRVEIRVVVGANGAIKSALVMRSSRYPILDEQALDMVKRAFKALALVQPAPHGREFTVDVPVVFELQTG